MSILVDYLRHRTKQNQVVSRFPTDDKMDNLPCGSIHMNSNELRKRAETALIFFCFENLREEIQTGNLFTGDWKSTLLVI
jgi:hypothetical protein